MNHHVLFNLILCIISGINQHFFVIINSYNNRIAKVCRDNACAVVIRFCIVDLRFFAFHDSVNHVNYCRCKSTCIFEYGHSLFSCYKVLNVWCITVLTSVDRILSCVGSCKCVFYTKCCGVVGAENCVKVCSVRVVTSDDCIHSVLSFCTVQLAVATCSNSVCPDLTTSLPSSMYF